MKRALLTRREHFLGTVRNLGKVLEPWALRCRARPEFLPACEGGGAACQNHDAKLCPSPSGPDKRDTPALLIAQEIFTKWLPGRWRTSFFNSSEKRVEETVWLDSPERSMIVSMCVSSSPRAV